VCRCLRSSVDEPFDETAQALRGVRGNVQRAAQCTALRT
jgi:hypothetical protein